MSSPVVASPPTVAAPRTAVLVAAAGCAALTARPLLFEAVGADPAFVALLFGVLLALGVLWPSPARAAERPVVPAATALGIGIGAFVAGRLLLAGVPPAAPATALVLGLNTLAAVAEEAFFRRLVYGVLLAGGPGLALVGSAVLFAAVHVTVYGAWVLPLDLAAGLLFAWQRRVTGTWTVPAVTHAVANALVVL